MTHSNKSIKTLAAVMLKNIRIEEIIEHPATALFCAFAFAAVAFSGKFTVIGTRVCLILAWVIFLIALRTQAWNILAGCGLIAAGCLLLFASWLVPDAVPAYTGIIKPQPKLLFFSKDATQRKIQIGDSATYIIYVGLPDDVPPPPDAPFLPLINSSLLKVELINGRVAVSTRIFDVGGDLVAELIRNEWKVAPPPKTWDRNYTDDALEVKNPQGRIILQIKALPDLIQLQGEWWDNSGLGVRIMKNPDSTSGSALIQVFNAKADLNSNPIVPMFQYPSESHLGQLAQH